MRDVNLDKEGPRCDSGANRGPGARRTRDCNQMIAWCRHLHAHAELSFEEAETAALVEGRVVEFGRLEIERLTGTSNKEVLRHEVRGTGDRVTCVEVHEAHERFPCGAGCGEW
jgi:hypothetical protein